MANTSWGNVYKKLGARPLINATGNQTVRGGSTPSAVVRKAMLEADASYVEMAELLEKSGRFIAERLGVEDAYITARVLYRTRFGISNSDDRERS